MTEEQRRDRMLGRCILIGFFWLGLHLYVAYRNFRDSLYVTFNGWTFFWIAVYTFTLLALDVQLYFLNSSNAAKKLGEVLDILHGGLPTDTSLLLF